MADEVSLGSIPGPAVQESNLSAGLPESPSVSASNNPVKRKRKSRYKRVEVKKKPGRKPNIENPIWHEIQSLKKRVVEKVKLTGGTNPPVGNEDEARRFIEALIAKNNTHPLEVLYNLMNDETIGNPMVRKAAASELLQYMYSKKAQQDQATTSDNSITVNLVQFGEQKSAKVIDS